jgi:hypothetical protein
VTQFPTFVAAIMAMLMSNSSVAAGAYKCELRQVVSLNAEGRLSESGRAALLIKENKQFLVDRTTGRIVGATGIANYNAGFGKPKVLDPGSGSQSFKVLTVYRGFTSVDYLLVKEFVAGPIKPFIFITDSEVLSGICSSA